MISIRRVLTVVRKDVFWALGNLKLLGVMVLPVFFVVFFSQVDSAATFAFSLTFVNAFVGIFSTSYLIIEEKNKGTLLALLTTPLTGPELLIGKFLFNLILCLSFSILAIILNGRLDVIANPLIFFNIVLFAGTTCFFGYVIGVFFKNEQEMSVLAPFLMVAFCFGDAAEKIAGGNVHAFFPDFHLSQVLKDVPWTWNNLLVHSFFSLLLFLVSFLMAVFYTRFYFSNNREKRWSNLLFVLVGIFGLTLATSGFYAKTIDRVLLTQEGLQNLSLHSEHWSVELTFDPDRLKAQTLLESRSKNITILKPHDESEYQYVVSIRKTSDDERTPELRDSKFREDSNRQILSAETLSHGNFSMKQWFYTEDERFIVLTESFCDLHIFQFSLDQKLKDMVHFKESFQQYQKIMESFQLTCR